MKPLALALLAFAALAPLPAIAKPAATQAEKPDPDEGAMQAAQMQIATGRSADALPILDGIIARKTATYAGEKRLLYCARSMRESLSYLLIAVNDSVSAITLSPLWADAYFYRGFVLVDLGRPDEALAAFERAITLSPLNAHYLAETAELSKARRRWDTALALFRRADEASALSPDDDRVREQGRAWRGIGFVLIEQGKLDEAQTWFEKCIALNPSDRRAQGELDFIRQQREKAKLPRS